MRIAACIAPALCVIAASAAPPGSPMSDFGPGQVSLSLFFDHSGQDLYKEAAASVMNTAGLSADYAPWPYLQLGVWAGADEFDVAVPESQAGDTSKHSFDSDYKFAAGATAKLATPRFVSNMLRLVAFGGAGYFKNEDAPGNLRKGFTYDAGASIQMAGWRGLNLVLGGEFYAIEGEQQSASGGSTVPFGISAEGAPDYLRGLVGLEYYFKGRNKPFISIAFRPTGALGWDDKLGLRGGSICVSMGAIATLPGKGKDKGSDEESSGIDEQQ